MDNPEILFLRCTHFDPTESELARLHDLFPSIHLTIKEQDGYSAADLKRAHIIAGFPKVEDLRSAENLRWLQTPSAGVQQYAEKNIYAHDHVILTSARGTYGRQISDHVIAMIIAHNHYLWTYRDQMKQKVWKRYFPLTDIWESTIVIIGFGDIGSNIARKAKALDMHVIVVRRQSGNIPEYVDEMYTQESLDELLYRADYLAVCTASTKETLNLLDSRRLSELKRGCCVINVARGNIIEEKALIENLESGHLGGAALDVTESEPLDVNSPLWTLPNVMITPHASGLSMSDSPQIVSLFERNLRLFLERKPLINMIDFDKKY